MIPLPLERLLALVVPLDDALLDPLDEVSITAGSSSAPSSLRASIAASDLFTVDGGLGHGSILPPGRLTSPPAMVFFSTDAASEPRHAAQRLIAHPARGLVYGNRGCLHDEQGRIRRRGRRRRWIACRLEFRGWHREPLMQPGKFTELFFLDEATAFAAGHRPCALCRREDYVRFGELWGELHPGAVGADAIDAQLHAERVDGTRRSGFTKPRRRPARRRIRARRGRTVARPRGGLRRWTPAGYAGRRPLPARGRGDHAAVADRGSPAWLGRRRAAPASVGREGLVTFRGTA